MSAQDHLNQVQFIHSTSPAMTDHHWIEATRRREGEKLYQGELGSLEWNGPEGKYPNEIQDVYVAPHMRRKGIATEMLRRAREITPGLQHSADLTDDGQAWAEARP